MTKLENTTETNLRFTKKDLAEMAKELFFEFVVPTVSIVGIGTGLGYFVGGTRGAVIGGIAGLYLAGEYHPIEEPKESCDHGCI